MSGLINLEWPDVKRTYKIDAGFWLYKSKIVEIHGLANIMTYKIYIREKSSLGSK